jgi:ankyrin repeat protein
VSNAGHILIGGIEANEPEEALVAFAKTQVLADLIPPEGERSSLSVALLHDRWALANLLLDKGLDATHEFNTFLPADDENPGILRFESPLLMALGHHGSHPGPLGRRDEDPEHLARRIAMVERLGKGGADMNQTMPHGSPVWFYAFLHTSLTLLETMERYGARTRERGFEKESPLWWAARPESIDLCDAMVARGARVDDADDWGNTPLSNIFSQDSPVLLEWLSRQTFDITRFGSARVFLDGCVCRSKFQPSNASFLLSRMDDETLTRLVSDPELRRPEFNTSKALGVVLGEVADRESRRLLGALPQGAGPVRNNGRL